VIIKAAVRIESRYADAIGAIHRREAASDHQFPVRLQSGQIDCPIRPGADGEVRVATAIGIQASEAAAAENFAVRLNRDRSHTDGGKVPIERARRDEVGIHESAWVKREMPFPWPISTLPSD
jgi:hypothetical protein